MSLVTKIVKGNPDRKTRLHSTRGQLLPRSEVLAAVRSVGYRLARRYPPGPWMTPGAVRHLDQVLTKQMSLLELGSGVSTAWYADKVGRVVSVEPNPTWAAKVKSQLGAVRNCELIEGDIEAELRRIQSSGEQFDVVIVDFDTHPDQLTRPQAVEIARDIATTYIVLDDSDRADLRSADAFMADWQALRFPGVKSVPLAVVETTVFVKP